MTTNKSRGRFRGVSPSQLDAMSCRLNWHLGYQLGFRSKRIQPALDLGTGVHAGLEEFYKAGTNPVEAFNDWCELRRIKINPEWDDDLKKMDEIQDLGAAMLTGYVEEYGDDPEYETVATEATLVKRLPIPGKPGHFSRYTLTARLDGIVREVETGLLFSMEHKTYARLDPSYFELNPQFTTQVWLGQHALGALGLEDEEIVGVLYNGLRKAQKTKRTTAPLYHREKLFRTPSQINAFLERAYYQCREFSSKNIKIYPQPGMMRCKMCDFKKPCEAYMRGEDMSFLIDEFFESGRATVDDIRVGL